MEDLLFVNKDELPSTTMGSTKSRLILPPIIARQRTSSLLTNATSTILDNETNNKFTLTSRQSTFMKSISEIS